MKETCAQLLGIIASLVNLEFLLQVVILISDLFDQKDWEVRYSSFLGIKYIFSVRPDIIPHALGHITAKILSRLDDKEEDVRVI